MKDFMRFVLALAIVVAVFAAEGARDVGEKESLTFRSTVEGKLKPWTHEEFANLPRNFQFAIVSDRTGGHRPGVFGSAVAKLNLLQPEFVMSVGDLIEGYTEVAGVIDGQRKEFDSLVEKLEMPFFYVPGNHDISNPTMAKDWEERYGHQYYHFVYQDVLFLCLCTEDPHHMRLSDKQVDHVEKALDENRDVRWTFVFMHNPLWTSGPEQMKASNWSKVEELIKDRKHTVFAGHYHVYTKHVRNNSKYFVLSTTGGARGRTEAGTGEMDHVVWVSMTDDGPRIAVLLLDGIRNENVATVESRLMVETLMQGNSMEVEPILTEDKDFKEAETTLRLSNPEEIPITLTGTFAGFPGMSVEPKGFNVTLKPNSERISTVRISLSRSVPVEEMVPIRLDWSISFDPPETGRVTLKGSRRVAIDRVRYVEGEFRDDFTSYEKGTDGKPVWTAAAGKWEMQDGEYHQTLTGGYDHFSAAEVCVRGDYRIETKVRLVKEILEGGFLFNMPSRGSKGSTQMVRFSGHQELWCGPFSGAGIFRLDHKVQTGLEKGEEWVTLAITVRNSKRTYDIELNGKTVAENLKLTHVPREGSGRCIGLVACRGHIAYDYLKVTPLGKSD